MIRTSIVHDQIGSIILVEIRLNTRRLVGIRFICQSLRILQEQIFPLQIFIPVFFGDRYGAHGRSRGVCPGEVFPDRDPSLCAGVLCCIGNRRIVLLQNISDQITSIQGRSALESVRTGGTVLIIQRRPALFAETKGIVRCMKAVVTDFHVLPPGKDALFSSMCIALWPAGNTATVCG